MNSGPAATQEQLLRLYQMNGRYNTGAKVKHSAIRFLLLLKGEMSHTWQQIDRRLVR